LNRIAAKPTSDNNKGREGYSLSAGFALGLVNLGRAK